MNNTGIQDMNFDIWSRRILNFYWSMVALSVAGELVALFVTISRYPDFISGFIVEKMVIPTVFQLVLLILCEYVVHIKKVYSSPAILLAGTFIAMTLIVNNPNVDGLQTILLLPMAVSIIFFRMKTLLFSFMASITAFFMMYAFSSSLRSATSEYEFSAYLVILCGGFILYTAVLKRGVEILGALRRTIVNEQELRVQTAIMDKLAKTDALTGLSNHKIFHEKLDLVIDESRLHMKPLQVAVLDIDNFKNINDTYGHSVGDVILKRVAATIAGHTTENDLVARYGGEEFAIIFSNKKLEDSFRILEQIREAIAALRPEEMQGNPITLSIGIKDYEPGMSKYELFAQADALLYQAKRSGKNRTVI